MIFFSKKKFSMASCMKVNNCLWIPCESTKVIKACSKRPNIQLGPFICKSCQKIIWDWTFSHSNDHSVYKKTNRHIKKKNKSQNVKECIKPVVPKCYMLETYIMHYVLNLRTVPDWSSIAKRVMFLCAKRRQIATYVAMYCPCTQKSSFLQ